MQACEARDLGAALWLGDDLVGVVHDCALDVFVADAVPPMDLSFPLATFSPGRRRPSSGTHLSARQIISTVSLFGDVVQG